MVRIIINAVAPPFGPYRRIRKLGEAVGSFVATLNKRVLIVGTEFLSHEPPVPLLQGAKRRGGRVFDCRAQPTPEFRAARQARTLATGQVFGTPECGLTSLNSAWDEAFIQQMIEGRLDEVDQFDIDAISHTAGRSTHEVRTQVAAFSALRAWRLLRAVRLYRPINGMDCWLRRGQRARPVKRADIAPSAILKEIGL